MHLNYLDETFQKVGTPDEYFAYGALTLTAEGIKNLSSALQSVIDDFSSKVPPAAELHGYQVFHSKDDWAELYPRESIQVFASVFEAISTHAEAVIIRGINGKRLRERQRVAQYPKNHTPEHQALIHILQCINQGAENEQKNTLIIADMIGDRDANRQHLRDFQQRGTPGSYLNSTLDRIVDTIHFVPSHQSRGIQAIDMVLYIYNRRRRLNPKTHPRERKALEMLWNKLEFVLRDVRDWPE